MDRRVALKKLAAGGAIASGASLVLSSHDVAYAASPPGTNLSNVPGDGEDLLIVFTPNLNGSLTIGDDVSPVCFEGDLTVTYSWQVNGFGFSGGNRHLLMLNAGNLNEVIHDTTGSSGYSVPSSTHGTIELRKTTNGNDNPKPLDATDTYNISVIISWSCGVSAPLVAEYLIQGTGSAAPIA
jgi:hypothetical protein